MVVFDGINDQLFFKLEQAADHVSLVAVTADGTKVQVILDLHVSTLYCYPIALDVQKRLGMDIYSYGGSLPLVPNIRAKHARTDEYIGMVAEQPKVVPQEVESEPVTVPQLTIVAEGLAA
jgi:hypothetical protein